MGRRSSFWVSGVVAAAVCLIQTAGLACDCHNAHVMSLGVPAIGGFQMAQPILGSVAMAHWEIPAAPVPPGTLGTTYSRPSHPVPVDEHPRTGILAVRATTAIPYMSVQNMGGIKMKSGIWLFESRRPLDPGVSQIVRVEARQSAADIEPYETRFVRLIPGRIVYLDF